MMVFMYDVGMVNVTRIPVTGFVVRPCFVLDSDFVGEDNACCAKDGHGDDTGKNLQ